MEQYVESRLDAICADNGISRSYTDPVILANAHRLFVIGKTNVDNAARVEPRTSAPRNRHNL